MPPSWLRQATYLGSVLCGVIAAAQPQYAVFLIPAATFLAGYATTNPADKPPAPSAGAVANLAVQLQAQMAALKTATVKAAVTAPSATVIQPNASEVTVK